MVQVHHICPARLFQSKLIIPQWFVDFQLEDVQSYFVLLAGPEKLDARWKADTIVLFIVGVAGIGLQIALFIIDELAVRLQIGAAENDLAREAPARRSLLDHDQFIFFLQNAMPFGVGKNLYT